MNFSFRVLLQTSLYCALCVLSATGVYAVQERAGVVSSETRATITTSQKFVPAFDSVGASIVWWQAHRMTDSLVRACAFPSPKHRAQAVYAMASVQDTTMLKPLAKMLLDTSVAVRVNTAFALGQSSAMQTYTVATVILLNHYAQEKNERVREALIDALGKCGDARAAEWLVSLKHKSVKLKIASALALSRIAQRGILSQAQADKASKYCYQLIRDNKGSLIRFAATYFFVRTPITVWTGVADSLAVLLNDKLMRTLPEAQSNIIRALARANKPTYIKVLIDASTVSDWRVRYECVRALSRFTIDSVQNRILAMTSDNNLHVQLAALRSVFDNPMVVHDEFIHQAKTICLRPLTDWRVRASYLNIIARRDPNWVLVLMDRWREIPNSEFMATLCDGFAIMQKSEVWAMLDSLSQTRVNNTTIVAVAALRALHSKWQVERRDSTQGYRLSEIVNVYYPIWLRALKSGDIALVSTAAEYCTDSLFAQKGSANEMIALLRTVRPFTDVEMVQSLTGALVKLRAVQAIPILDSLQNSPDDGIALACGNALSALQNIAGVAQKPSIARKARYTAPYTMNDIRALALNQECTLQTSAGAITLKLFPDLAPISVLNFLAHARRGLFNDVPFHRVVSNFVIQGGDYERRDGYGGPRFTIPSEFTHIPFTRGTLGMASAGKDTEGSQYFIMHSYAPHLDGRYTAFGQVITGLDVVDAVLQGHKVLSVVVK